jgi:hypothetical protein
MPLKKSIATASILTPIDQKQNEEALLLEAEREKRKAMDPPSQDNLD